MRVLICKTRDPEHFNGTKTLYFQFFIRFCPICDICFGLTLSVPLKSREPVTEKKNIHVQTATIRVHKKMHTDILAPNFTKDGASVDTKTIHKRPHCRSQSYSQM